MATDTTLDLLTPVHRLNVDRYLRMGAAGMYGDDARIELIDGVVVEMTPIGGHHVAAVMWLTKVIARQLDDDHMVSVQMPIVLRDERSVPEPDLSVVSLARDDARIPERPLLAIEVSASSLRYDRRTKARLYAAGGLEEYWIVNLAEATIEVHRDPADGAWRERTVHRPGKTIHALALPVVSVDVAELFAFVERYPSD
jgi:Uma2 family endonuclease